MISLLLCLHFFLPKTVPEKEHISCVLFQTQSIWLGWAGRDPSLKLDNSKSPALEELQDRMFMGLLLYLWNTLSAAWIQTQTTQICQFLGKATVRFDSVSRKAVKRQSTKSKFCLRDMWPMLIKPHTCIQGRIWHTQACPFLIPI